GDVHERSGPDLHELLVADQEPELPFSHVEELLAISMHMWARGACRTRLEGHFDEVVVARRLLTPGLEHDADSRDRERNPFPFLRPEHTTLSRHRLSHVDHPPVWTLSLFTRFSIV